MHGHCTDHQALANLCTLEKGIRMVVLTKSQSYLSRKKKVAKRKATNYHLVI
jgi:hypothetical protein